MSAKRDMNSVLVSTIESTEGVTPSANNATDVIICENLQIKFNQTAQSTQEVTGTLDPAGDIPVGGAVQVTFDTWLRGSGTPGTAPEIGKLFKSCAYSETITATIVGAPTLGTSGTASSIIVPNATFTGGVDAYLGMVAQLTGNPTGPIFSSIIGFSAGQLLSLAESFSPSLSGSTLVQIPKNVLYSPVSPPTTIPSITHRVYKDGILHVVSGARGTLKGAWSTGKGTKLSWSYNGILTAARTDVPNPTNASPDSAISKLVWRNDNNNGGFLFNLARHQVQDFNFDTGVTLDNAPNPNQPDGFDVTDIGGRVMKADFNPRLTAVGTEDILALAKAGTTVPISLFSRRGAGNSCALTIPAWQPSPYEYTKQGPMLAQQLSGKCTGANRGAFFCFF